MLPAEALVAVTGIFPDKPLQKQDFAAAMSLPHEWTRLVKTFFDQKQPKKFRMYPRPEHEATLRKLTEGSDPTTMTGKLADPDIVTAYLDQIHKAREYVRERWPSLQMQTFTGPRLLEPGWTTMAAAWAIYAVVNDPTRLLIEMCGAGPTGDQVDAVKEVYPGLYAGLQTLIEERKNYEVSRKKSWTITYPKERVIRIVKKLPPGVSIAPAPQAPARPVKTFKIDSDAFATRAQRIEAK